MLTYPYLSEAEQKSLPQLSAAPVAMPAKFADSTHQLWHCDTVDGPMVLKVCQPHAIAQSSFWQGINHLFGIQFPQQLGQTLATAAYLKTHGFFNLPTVISAVNNRYVLTRFVAGTDVDQLPITHPLITQLAQHIGQLHQQRFKTWGDLHAPQWLPEQWNQRLHASITQLAQQSSLTIPTALLDQALSQALTLNETAFVPIMPDLRWDQLRQSTNGQLALIDLDAFVIGPRNLELVLMLYLLTPSQLTLFKDTYCQWHDWPDLNTQSAYQLLLFLMNVLGETDCNAWMSRF